MRYVRRNNQEVNSKSAGDISSRFNFSELTGRILASRGLSIEDIEGMLSDDAEKYLSNYDIPNIQQAAQRIEEAMMAGENIAVFGDYDADGICGTSIIVNAFRSFGYDEITYYIPNRISEGYGLNNEAIDVIAEKECSLIITVDCGIANCEEIDYAKEMGIDVVVTDHHLPGQKLPDTILVNPKLEENSICQNLCGAAVALKLMCVLFDEGIFYESCDLAAIATIADMVDLTGENRFIVKSGLKRIRSKRNKNLNYLIDECVKNKGSINADDISYFIAPAINAAGRLDVADKCVALFTGESRDPKETAAILAHDNYNRKKIEKETVESALKIIKRMDLTSNRAIVLFDKGWHQGVLGIAASKIKNKYHRPVILFTENNGEYVGSARSIDDVNIHDAISYCSQYIGHFGGHFMAAGLSISPENFLQFKEKLEEYLKNIDTAVFEPKLQYDVKAKTCELNLDFLSEMEKLEPFGKGNPQPVIFLEDIKATQAVKMGDDNQHFRCRISNDISQIAAVAFSNTKELCGETKYNALVSLNKNVWNGNVSVQAIIQDIRENYTIKELGSLIKAHNEQFKFSVAQSFYSKSRKLVPVNSDFLFQELNNSAFSCLIIALDDESAINAIKILGEKYNNIDIRFSTIEKDKINHNTLVIAPDMERIDIGSYKNIFIMTKYDLSEYYMPLLTEDNVYIINGTSKINDMFSLSIERLREIYIKIKENILKRRYDIFYNGEEQINLWEIRSALMIFGEAGLVNYDINSCTFSLTEKKKTDITSSKTYRNFQVG